MGRSSTAVACSAPTSSSSSTTTTVLHHPHHPLPQTSVPFSPMDQIEELDVVAAYCVGAGYNASASAASAATATGTPAPTSALSPSSILLKEPPARVLTSGVQAIPVVASGTATVEVDCLEKALGIEFSDPNGVVQRQLLAK